MLQKAKQKSYKCANCCFAIMSGPDSFKEEMLVKWWDALQANLWSCQPCHTSCIMNMQL